MGIYAALFQLLAAQFDLGRKVLNGGIVAHDGYRTHGYVAPREAPIEGKHAKSACSSSASVGTALKAEVMAPQHDC
ncbi:MAG: hypothetical protein ACWGIK_16685 [Achromobacter pulmonis]